MPRMRLTKHMTFAGVYRRFWADVDARPAQSTTTGLPAWGSAHWMIGVFPVHISVVPAVAPVPLRSDILPPVVTAFCAWIPHGCAWLHQRQAYSG